MNDKLFLTILTDDMVNHVINTAPVSVDDWDDSFTTRDVKSICKSIVEEMHERYDLQKCLREGSVINGLKSEPKKKFWSKSTFFKFIKFFS